MAHNDDSRRADSRFRSDVPLFWQAEKWRALAARFRNGQLPHALLVHGAAGLGKTLFVHGFSGFMLCREPAGRHACGQCANCRLGSTHPHPDISVLRPEGDSREIRIEQVRALSLFLGHTSHAGGVKVAIIEQAHRLNHNAAAALLKTLEEPTRGSYLFLVSRLPGALPVTVRSRCQRLLLNCPSTRDTVNWLKAHFPGDGHEDLERLALAAGNRPLAALALAEQDTLEQHDELNRRLGDLATGRASPQALVALARKIGEEKVIEHLALTLTILVKYLLAQQTSPQPPGDDVREQAESGELKPLLAAFRAGQGEFKPRLMALFALHEEALRAARQLGSGANPDPGLILESLMWRWSRLTQARAGQP